MNYLEEIKPLYQYVELYLEGKGCPNHETLQKLSDIDYRLRESEKVRIYGNERTEIYPTDIGCGSCVKGMMVNLKRWVNIKTNEGNVFEFKGVPQKEKVFIAKDPFFTSKTNPNFDPEINELKKHLEDKVVNLKDDCEAILFPSNDDNDVNILPDTSNTVINEVDSPSPSQMKWGEFKTYCKGLGINSKGKTRAELEDELKNI